MLATASGSLSRDLGSGVIPAMATLMSHTHIMSSMSSQTCCDPSGCSTRSRSGGMNASAPAQSHIGLRSLPITRLRKSRITQNQAYSPRVKGMSGRVAVQSLLEAPREAAERSKSIINPAEELLEKLAKLPTSGDMGETEAADRLFLWEDVPKLAEKQTFSVYELNEFNRDSPAFLEFSRQTVNTHPSTGAHIHALGDQVPFTNTLYDGSLKTRLGITAGICLLMKNYPGKGTPDMHKLPYFVPDHYETIMTWYFGDMGHICGQGPFINFQDTLMSITGGVGFFREARGVVRLHNLTPFKFFYTFTLAGIPKLPKHLTGMLVPPTIDVTAHPDAAACKAGFTLPNYTD